MTEPETTVDNEDKAPENSETIVTLASARDKLYNCAHCSGTGTCSNGKEGASCAACAQPFNVFREKERFGLTCSTCGGLGQTSTHLHKVHQKTTPYLAWGITICSFLLMLIFGMVGYFTESDKDYFNEVMGVCATLLAAVTGYYFSRTGKKAVKPREHVTDE